MACNPEEIGGTDVVVFVGQIRVSANYDSGVGSRLTNPVNLINNGSHEQRFVLFERQIGVLIDIIEPKENAD